MKSFFWLRNSSGCCCAGGSGLTMAGTRNTRQFGSVCLFIAVRPTQREREKERETRD